MLDRLSQLPPREQLGLGLACAFALFFVADQVVVKPVTKTLNRLDVDIEVASKQVVHNQEVLQYKDSVEAQYEQVKNLIGISAPEQEAIEAFKSHVDEMALRNGISLKSMQHLAPETTDFLVTYFVEISDFEAETLSLVNFLHEVQNAPGMLRLQRMSITSQNENSMIKGSLVISKVMTLAGEQE
jgi:type II secretory pathway component PulM